MQGDIIASLKARLDLLCDEAEQALEDAQDKYIISPQDSCEAQADSGFVMKQC